jgi:transposase InsO family protein
LKAAIFLLCHKTIDAIRVATLYVEKVFPFYSVPRRVISDRDPQFTAQFVKELCITLKIDQNLSTAYHPQMDGQSERANQLVEQYLWIYGNEEQNNWVDLLPLAQFTHNTWPNESTGQMPFDLLIGHTPTMVVAERETTIPEIA